MASFPSGATIVTTSDESGVWWGFTASSFCSVSMDPPLVLTCEEMPFVYFRRTFHSLAIGDDKSADTSGRDLAPAGTAGTAGAGHADLMPVVIELDLGWI